ncbi:Short-chain dehydrogenase/reductase 3 [Phytophthora oleae]|uniref:Short-chain dehydrogenase/reductase 3 n=1 Tax=Phytophthora oleae TaxID=2107226 RepID=A0ABD3F9L7_9STRA
MAFDWLWPQKSVHGQVVLVTGGAMGFGRLIAAQLGVIVLSTSPTASKSFRRSRQLPTAQVVTRISSRWTWPIERKFTEPDKRCWGISELSISALTTLEYVASDLIERTFAVNTLVHFWTVRAFLPEIMKRNRGQIMTLPAPTRSSGSRKWRTTTRPSSRRTDSSVTFDKSLGKRGINLPVVCPSSIKTGMFEGVRVPMFTAWLSQYGADQVVKAVRHNQWRLLMPSIVGLLVLIVALTPIGFYDFMPP